MSVPTPEDRELLALDVAEVSLVDRGAIRRTFSVVKALEDDVKRTTKAAVEKTEPVLESVEKVDGLPDGLPEDVKKAAAPLLTALAGERLGLISAKVTELQTGLGSMKKEDAQVALYGLHDLIWSAERDVVAVSKAMGVEVEDKVETEVAKAHPRKMTTRRLNELKGLLEKLTGLAKEFETDDEEDPAMPTETEKNEGAALEATIAAAVTKALAPLEGRLAAIEKVAPVTPAVEPATTMVDTAKAEATPPTWLAKLEKSINGIGQRLDALEGSSNAGGGNTTDATVTKSAGGLWDGVVS